MTSFEKKVIMFIIVQMPSDLMKISKSLLVSLLLIPLSVSAEGSPSQSVNFNIYTPILSIAVVGYMSTKLIRRNKLDQNKD